MPPEQQSTNNPSTQTISKRKVFLKYLVFGIGALIIIYMAASYSISPISRFLGVKPTCLGCNDMIVYYEPDNSTWQTYRNEEYGFEFRYPKDWEVFNKENYWGLGPISIPEDSLLTIYIVKELPEIGMGENPHVEVVTMTDTIFNNLPAKLVSVRNSTVNQKISQSYNRIYVKNGNSYFSIGQPTINNSDFPFDSSYNDIVKQILSTFKFVEPTTKSPAQTNPEGQFWGVFAGVLCPTGYQCKYDGSYPDAGGKCVK